ncbi:hypothetical protein [Duganella sp. FT27W]|uniref:hypothetical protein n=1 Tax=Duganella sp. FT27W TaxID=2654636 RepID=UPI00128E0F33|nr:hypothetical protein [Duganella sp. FT27W]MPQ58357.1 hypothetical protein [Duganella sp. FT27W]
MSSAPTPVPAASGSTVSPPASGVVGSSHSLIYQQLVTDSNDAVGAIAYVLYKRDKIAFIEATYTAHGRAPNADELKVFHTQSCMLPVLEGYRTQAKQLGEAFLSAGLANKMRDFEDEIRESVLNQNVSAVLSELKSKKRFVAWAGDIVANLGVNVLTILIIGALLGGYQALAKFNANVEKLANVPPATEPAPVPPSEKPTPNR